MTEFTIGLDRVDFDTIRDALQNELSNRESWKDIIEASTGQTLIDFIAAIGAFNQQSIGRSLQETFFDTQLIPSSVYRLSRTFGIHIIRKSPALVTVELERSNNNISIIPAYSQFQIENIDFFNRETIGFSGDSIIVELAQGTIRRESFISNGSNFQRYSIGEKDFSVSDYYSVSETTGDIYAIVGGTIPDSGDLSGVTGGDKFEKTLQGLWHYTSTDKVFFENTRADGRVEIWFGNNIYGISPALNQSIVFIWIETLGFKGNSNILNKTVTYLGSNSITGTALTNSINGDDEKTPDFYKRFGSDIFSSRRRAVTRSDYQAIILSYPGIIDALVEGQQDIDSRADTVTGLWGNIRFLWVGAETRILTYDRFTKQARTDENFNILEKVITGLWSNNITMWTTSPSVDKLLAYNLVSKERDTTKDITLHSSNSDPRNIWGDNTTIWVLDGSIKTIFAYTIADGSRDTTKEFNVIDGINYIDIVNAGTNYTSIPTLTIGAPVSGTTATATAIILAKGVIEEIIVDSGGSGYTGTPVIRITGGSGSGATATATVIDGSISSINITNRGSGYLTAPTVDITGNGTGATATATISVGKIIGYNITNPGSGYGTGNVAVTITGGNGSGASLIAKADYPYNRGIWGDNTTIWVSNTLTKKLYAYTITSGNRDSTKDFILIDDNDSPWGIWGSDNYPNGIIYVAQYKVDTQPFIYAYRMSDKSVLLNNNINIGFESTRDINWMNVIRITLLTKQTWGDTEWKNFTNWLNNRGIATIHYERNMPEELTVNIVAKVYCARRVNLNTAKGLIEADLIKFFRLRLGSLGTSYYLSDIYNRIKNIKDEVGLFVDYIELTSPIRDTYATNIQYISLGTTTITTAYSTGIRIESA